MIKTCYHMKECRNRIIVAVLFLALSATGCQTSEQKQAEEAAKAADYFENEYQKAKEDYDDLQADLNRYNEMQNKIKMATPGTSEFKCLVSENNAIVRKLISKYPEIANEVTVR